MDEMNARFSNTSTALAVGITAAVTLACAAGTYLYWERHFDTLVATERAHALEKAELIRSALEHGMLQDDQTIIEAMLTTFGREPGVVDVMLVDREGVVQFASGTVEPGEELSVESPTCQACHKYPPAQRTSARVIETRGGEVLRTVVPFRNRKECHECHDPDHAINGVLISDMDAGKIRAAANSDMRWLAVVSGAIALLLVGAIGVIVRLAILRRLQRLETNARLMSQGDLSRRAPAGGTDTISWLAREFNAMADSVSGLVSEVRSERERLETVINSIDDGIVVLDPDRRIVAANEAFIRRTGYARDELLGCSCQKAGAGMCSVSDCPTLACLRSHERQIRICERRTPDGAIAWEEVHASPIAGSSGGPSHVVEVWRDISERRTAEARLAESHRLASLGLLASGFSHEMNTPLGTVLACVEGIAREMKRGNAEAEWQYIQDNASTARDQVLRCRAITQQFLRMSRGQSPQSQIVDVGTVVQNAARLVEPTARALGIALKGDCGGDSVRVCTDEAELQHVLINLLLNAVQACSSGGSVHARVSGGASARIAIADNGCGIPPEHQQRIFEPFFSLRNGGTGLGLFFSLNFVRGWGGDIVVRSTPGGGSTFEIVLPAVPESAEAVPA
jgi:PAS domain S-box-containing protein